MQLALWPLDVSRKTQSYLFVWAASLFSNTGNIQLSFLFTNRSIWDVEGLIIHSMFLFQVAEMVFDNDHK